MKKKAKIEAEIKALKALVEVLEFKEAAKGERFILGDCRVGYPFAPQEVKWLSADGKRVVTDYICHSFYCVKINGNYIEVRDMIGDVAEAYRVKNDVLVDMDIEVYRKAFYPEQKANDDEKNKKGNRNEI